MKKIPQVQVIQRVKLENPWWQTPHKIPKIFTAWTPRPYLELFYPLATNLSIRRAVVLLGPRRVGKTVMIHHAIQRLIEKGINPKNICYFSVDHPIYNGLGMDEFLEAYKGTNGIDYRKENCFFFFDEIQYLKNWEAYLKAIVDRYKTTKFIVSGSSAAALRLKSTESGAGRFTDFMLPPLTFYEYLFLLEETNLVEIKHKESEIMPDFYTPDIEQLNNQFLNYLNFGGYPEVIFSEDIRRDPGRFIKSDIIDKVLLRDLPGLYGIQDIQELNYLFTTLAYNTANEISLEELSQGSGVGKNTIKRYIEYLEAAFLLRIVHRIDRNGKRFKRANFFKVYLTNPSIRSALFAPVKDDDDVMGSLVETAVFAQWFHSPFPIHYARWKNGEVDIVGLNKEQKVNWAVEAKWSDRYFHRPNDLKSLISFCHTQNLNRALITTKTCEGEKTVSNVRLEYKPASLYCYMLGFNIIQGKKIKPVISSS